MIVGTQEHKEDILSHITSDMFSNLNYKALYAVIERLKRENKPLEIADIIENGGKKEIKQLAIDCQKEYITAANWSYYVNKVQNAYFSRLCAECTSLDGYETIKALKNRYEIKNDTVRINTSTDALILEYYNKWGTEIKTYYRDIDKCLGTLQGGDIMILAGATGMGKTCMMLNLLMSMAKNGKKVLVFSLEMSLKQLQNRIISAETGIPATHIRNFCMTDSEQEIYAAYALSEEFGKLDINVCTRYNLTVDDIKSETNRLNPDIVFIDYLGLVSSDIRGNAYERVSQVSRELKLTALETNTPFIVLHQLSRIASDRKEKRPLLSDLRDSGKIEQDADFITFVYRDFYYNSDASENDFEFIISKSRHGKGKATVTLDFDGERQLIRNRTSWI